MFRLLIVATACSATWSTMAHAEPIILDCQVIFARSNRQEHRQIQIDLEATTVLEMGSTWKSGIDLPGGFVEWVQVNGHIVSWGLKKDNVNNPGGVEEVDMLSGHYTWWLKTPDRWFSQGDCTRRGSMT